MKPPVQQQSIWHFVEVKKWEHTVLPYDRKNPLPFPLFRSGRRSLIFAMPFCAPAG